MKYYIGIDGGGTKTSLAIGDERGKIFLQKKYDGCSYQEIGVEAVIELLFKAVTESLNLLKIDKGMCAGCCIGLPCYGENGQKDRVIVSEIKKVLSPIPVYVVNDGIVGWAGSLECQAGIHLVAGTGSIAIGCDQNGMFARCGGWNEHFGDEGSCYWIGRKLMELFTKEADGRIPKGPLYTIVRKTYQIEQDFEFIEIMIQKVLPYRKRVSELQMLALEAANQGDQEVIVLYQQAAKELALLVSGVRRKLSWETGKIPVSYFGGLFYAEQYVLPVLEEELKRQDCVLSRPKHTATEGALLLAVHKFWKEKEK